MAHHKAYLRYEAYEYYNGWFPANFVICVYKGFGFNKRVFEKITEERLNNIAS